ncbi:MAG: hypothetical protein IPH77_10250 [Ignavibacteria bacterium]|nr:hypothetical protein [Ignavibacteria bacterium]
MKKKLLLFTAVIMLCASAILYLFNVNEKELSENNSSEKSKDRESEIKYPSDIEYIKRTFPFGQADPDAHLEALKKGQEMRSLAESDNSESQWEFAGPTNIGGRISDLEYDPNNSQIIYAGAATGGIFKSTNGGLNFFPVFDDIAVLPIGDIVVDPVNSNIIYAGTGEANGGHNNFAGGGISKSTNGGTSWQMTGLQNTVSYRKNNHRSF